MGDAYPELRKEEQRIREVIRMEEERFGETLERGLVLLEDATAKLKSEKKQFLSGEIAFRLYDTYGFPLDLTEDILRNEDIAVDEAEFEQLMEAQRTRGREARVAACTLRRSPAPASWRRSHRRTPRRQTARTAVNPANRQFRTRQHC